jgi:tetratricopeptide (TPR) repeat protein
MRGSIAVLALLALTSGALAEEAPVPGATPAPAAAVVQKPPKPAELRAEQLDVLLAELHKAGPQSSAVEEKIWALWGASDSPTAEVLLGQAKIAIWDGADEQALSILNRLIGANPDFAEAWNKRALLYFAMGKYDEALKDIDHTLDLEPRHFGALAGKGVILARQKKYAAARDAYEQALAINPNLEDVKTELKGLDRVEQGI